MKWFTDDLHEDALIFALSGPDDEVVEGNGFC